MADSDRDGPILSSRNNREDLTDSEWAELKRRQRQDVRWRRMGLAPFNWPPLRRKSNIE